MLKLTDEQLDWLLERIPDPPRSPKGGRPPAEKRKVVQGIFWILDNGAKWKDLPSEFGPKSTVHRWFKKWVDPTGENTAHSGVDASRRQYPVEGSAVGPVGTGLAGGEPTELHVRSGKNR